MVEFKGIDNGEAQLGFENARRFTPSLHGPMVVTSGERTIGLGSEGIKALSTLSSAIGRDDISEKLTQIGAHLQAATQPAATQNLTVAAPAPGTDFGR